MLDEEETQKCTCLPSMYIVQHRINQQIFRRNITNKNLSPIPISKWSEGCCGTGREPPIDNSRHLLSLGGGGGGGGGAGPGGGAAPEIG